MVRIMRETQWTRQMSLRTSAPGVSRGTRPDCAEKDSALWPAASESAGLPRVQPATEEFRRRLGFGLLEDAQEIVHFVRQRVAAELAQTIAVQQGVDLVEEGVQLVDRRRVVGARQRLLGGLQRAG